MAVRERIRGRRLANDEVAERKLGASEGIPAMGLDGFGSSACGPAASNGRPGSSSPRARPPAAAHDTGGRYRAIHEPMLSMARKLENEFPDREIAVLIPELVKQRWYQRLLHTHRAQRLRSQLLKHGGTRLTIINVPWYLDAPG
jgi:hypothetical protein